MTSNGISHSRNKNSGTANTKKLAVSSKQFAHLSQLVKILPPALSKIGRG